MNKNKFLLPFSLITIFSASCNSAYQFGSYTHTPSDVNKCYTADINHNGVFDNNETELTWSESYDKLMDDSQDLTILNNFATNLGIDASDSHRTSLARYEMLHEAEELLMSTNAVSPLYNYGDAFVIKDGITGVYYNLQACKFFDQLVGKSSGNYAVCVGTYAKTLDPTLNDDNGTAMLVCHEFIGALRWVKDQETDSPGVYTAKLAEGLCTVSETPTIEGGCYVYTIKVKNGACWDDGTPITRDDFLWTWRRASNVNSTSPWTQLFNCIRGYDDWCEVDDPTYEDASGIFSGLVPDPNDASAFKVYLINDCTYFKDLLASPQFCPLCKNVVKNNEKTWWQNPSTYRCSGPLKPVMIDNNPAGSVDLVKNNNYLYKDETTTQQIKFAFIDDDSSMFTQYRSNTLDMTDAFPSNMMDYIVQNMPTQLKYAKLLAIYYYEINANNNTFDVMPNQSERTREQLRRIFNLLINRYDLAHNLVKGGATAANGIVSSGIEEMQSPIWDGAKYTSGPAIEWHYRNTDLYHKALEAGGYANIKKHNNNPIGLTGILRARSHGIDDDERGAGNGFWTVPSEEKGISENDALTESINEVSDLMNNELKDLSAYGVKWDDRNKTFTSFPEITITTNSGAGHESICERIQYYASLFGIKIKIKTQEWNSYNASKQAGKFAIGRQGWTADYNDPRTYLDIFISSNLNNNTRLGKPGFYKSR